MRPISVLNSLNGDSDDATVAQPFGAISRAPSAPQSVQSAALRADAQGGPSPPSQRPHASPSADQTVAQMVRTADAPAVDQTIAQSGSAMQHPADQTVAQVVPPMDDPPADHRVRQQQSVSPLASLVPMATQQRWGWRRFLRLRLPSFPFGYRARRLLGGLGRWMPLRRTRPVPQLAASDRRPPRQSVEQAHPLDEPPSAKQYQQVVQELDRCRFAFAQELARNGKFRDAIAKASQITETSRLYPQAQTLIQRWQQF